MRIAYFCGDPGVPYGGTKGASVHMQDVIAALAAEGANVLLLVAAVARGAPELPAGVDLELLPGPGKGASVGDRLAAEPARAAWLEWRLRRFGATALYERLALHSVAGARAARALGIPHLVELNAPLPQEARTYRTLEQGATAMLLEAAVLAGAELVLAVSGPLARYARERGARRVEVFPNAVDIGRFPPRPAPNGRRPVAVFAGTLRPWHGIETLAEAWSLLGEEAPELLVVGDGPRRELLQAAGARVTGARPHSEVPGLLVRADIGLAPYARDAPGYFSPLKLFEYLAAGLATVAASIASVQELVGPEVAVLVQPGDAPALAEAVAGLAADAERRARLGAAGRALVEAEHTWARRAERILAAVAESAGVEARA